MRAKKARRDEKHHDGVEYEGHSAGVRQINDRGLQSLVLDDNRP